MIDIFFPVDKKGNFTISIEDGDLKFVDPIDSMIKISLFTDARSPSDLVADPMKQRGWMGELENIVPGKQIGSLLWLLDQAKLTQDNLNTAINYAQDAVNWIQEDEHLKSISVSGEIIARKGFRLFIDVVFLDGDTTNLFYDLWEIQGD